jgi:hypothetical protein
MFTLTERTHSGYHDSYTYAITFDPETGSFSTKEIDGTSGCFSADLRPPTATDSVIDQACEILADLMIKAEIEKITSNPNAPIKGKLARSLTTRGKNAGIVGKVMWIGPDSYRAGEIKVGLKVDGERKLRYLPVDRVEATEASVVDLDAIYKWVAEEIAEMRLINNWYDTLRNLNLIHKI